MANKIYIDGLPLVEGHFSGVGQYTLGILRGLDELIEKAKFDGQDIPEVKVIIPYNKVLKFKRYSFKHIGYKRFPLNFRYMNAFWVRRWLPPVDLWCGRGFYIFPRFISMPLLFSKSCLVIYDLSYEHYQHYHVEKGARLLSKNVRASLKKTKHVIAISQNTRREVLDFYKLSPESVKVATPATDPRLFYHRSQKEIDKVKTKYAINGDYILALSNLEPRKNLDSLVDAYCSLPKEITNHIGLLLVGVTGWKTDELFEKIKTKVQAGYNIMRPSSYVSDRDKPAIISGAKMLVYPSHYEGFGMPPLEALACGIPVITADNSSLPEVAGKAGKMVPSTDKKALQKAMIEYLEKIDRLGSETLKTGPAHARQFLWTKSAQVFLDVAKEMPE